MNTQLATILNNINESTGSSELRRAIYKTCPYSVTKIKEVMHKAFDSDAVAKQMFEKYFDVPGHKYYHMSVEEILAQWKAKGQFGMENGKALDKFTGLVLEKHESQEVLDKYISSLNPVAANKCKQWLDFYHKNIENKIEFVGRELMMHDSKLKVNGRLDALFESGNKLLLIDWKNDEKLSTDNAYGDKCYGPLYEYDDCDLNIYTIQVYIYTYILRKVYKLTEMDIVPLIVRIGENDFGIYSPIIPYSDKLVEEIISFAKKEINKKIES